MSNPKPSKLAAALNYLQQIANMRGEATPNDYQERFGLPGDATPSMSTVTQAARDFGGGVATNLDNRARDIAPIVMETVDPRPLQARPATVKMLGDVASIGKAIVTDPVGTGKSIVSGEADRAKLAMNNPRSMGEYTGSFIDPLRIASALSKGNIAKRDIFIGEKAKTWDANAASKALEMEKAGINPKEIWTETGTWRGPEGKLRQEISDVNSRAMFTHLEPNPERLSKLLLSHPEMYQAYPSLAEITQFGLLGPRNKGSYARTKISDNIHPTKLSETIEATGVDEPKLREVAVHELQHAIQEREGFDSGSNFSSLKSKRIPPKLKDTAHQRNSLEVSIANHMRNTGYPLLPNKMLNLDLPSSMEKARNYAKKYGDEKLTDLLDSFVEKNQKLIKYPNKIQQYLRKGGEAESRATEKRMFMTAAERRAKFPEESYDFPIKELMFDKKPRGTNKSTRNFVVFPGEEKKVRILERDGQPAPKQIAQALEKTNPAAQIEVDLYQKNNDSNTLHLSKIVVPKNQQGKGFGSQAMQNIIEKADADGKRVVLSPSTDYGATSVNRLKNFYKRFGFVENKGRNKDYAISESMYRDPKK